MQASGDMFPIDWSPPPVEFLNPRSPPASQGAPTEAQVGGTGPQGLRNLAHQQPEEWKQKPLDSDPEEALASLKELFWNMARPSQHVAAASSVGDTHTLFTSGGSGSYVNSLDYLLQEKREQVPEPEQEELNLQDCPDLDSPDLDEAEVALTPEHRMLVERFSVSQQVIPQVHPGETVFLPGCHPRPCILDCSHLKPRSPLEGLFLSSPPAQQLSFLHRGLLSNLYLHMPDWPVPLLQWLFQLLTWPPETSSEAFGLLWDLSVDRLFHPPGQYEGVGWRLALCMPGLESLYSTRLSSPQEPSTQGTCWQRHCITWAVVPSSRLWLWLRAQAALWSLCSPHCSVPALLENRGFSCPAVPFRALVQVVHRLAQRDSVVRRGLECSVVLGVTRQRYFVLPSSLVKRARGIVTMLILVTLPKKKKMNKKDFLLQVCNYLFGEPQPVFTSRESHLMLAEEISLGSFQRSSARPSRVPRLCSCTGLLLKSLLGEGDIHVWCPTLQEIIEVFHSLGAQSPALYPVGPHQRGGSVLCSEASLSWGEQQIATQEVALDISLSYICKFLTLCALAEPGAYPDDSLLGLMELLCQASLDVGLRLVPKTDLQQLLLLLLENVQEWPGKLRQLCCTLSQVSDHHHNLLALVQSFPDLTARSRQVRSQLSLMVIAQMLGQQETLPLWQEKTQLSSLSQLLSLMRPSSLRQHLSASPGTLPSCREKQPKATAELDHKVCYLCHSLLTLAGMVVSSQDITPDQWGELQLLCVQLDRHISTHIRESPQAMHRTKLKDLATQIYIRWQELLAHCQPQVQYFCTWEDI
ncbi:protein FAM178B [Dugong dugon]